MLCSLSFYTKLVDMRLLDVSTLKLAEYFGGDIPEYAILSHTWGEGEVLYGDLEIIEKEETEPGWKLVNRSIIEKARFKAGWKKVNYSCDQAKKDGFAFVWIDT
jgi:hypothetical protein